jgi:hypothetical protein
LQVLHVGISFEKPQQFVDDGRQVKFLCGDHREPLREVKPHLVPKDRFCSRTGSVGLVSAFVEDVLHQFKVLIHGSTLFKDNEGGS